MLAQTVPGLRDDFVDALAPRQAVVLGVGAGKPVFCVQYAPEQIRRKKTALGSNGLELVLSTRHVS
jgi:hypothetical protein